MRSFGGILIVLGVFLASSLADDRGSSLHAQTQVNHSLSLIEYSPGEEYVLVTVSGTFSLTYVGGFYSFEARRLAHIVGMAHPSVGRRSLRMTHLDPSSQSVEIERLVEELSEVSETPKNLHAYNLPDIFRSAAEQDLVLLIPPKVFTSRVSRVLSPENLGLAGSLAILAYANYQMESFVDWYRLGLPTFRFDMIFMGNFYSPYAKGPFHAVLMAFWAIVGFKVVKAVTSRITSRPSLSVQRPYRVFWRNLLIPSGLGVCGLGLLKIANLVLL